MNPNENGDNTLTATNQNHHALSFCNGACIIPFALRDGRLAQLVRALR
jgi:hypothetical protein